MGTLLGEYLCTLDDKSRIILPTALKKQISPEAQDKFVINRGFEGCLMLIPSNEWLILSRRFEGLDLFNKQDRLFMRQFIGGANNLQLDSSNRLLLPKPLLIYAGITRDITLSAYLNLIEVWDSVKYEEYKEREMKKDNYSDLAEEVMVRKKNKAAEDVS